MLQKLRIKNYQSHKDSELQFTEGINVIVGSSDAGKSAILRAVKWLLFNRPLGSSFIRKGSKECHVSIVTNTGEINRAKGGANVYIVNGKLYRAFGNSVPDTIRDVLNVSDINYQAQLSGHFLVLQSSGEVAKELNRSLNIDLIDLCSSKCGSEIRSLTKQLKLSRDTSDTIEEKLKGYKDLDDIVEEIEELEASKLKWKVLEDQYTGITEVLVSINDVNSKLKRKERKLVSKEELDNLIEEVEKIKKQVSEQLTLSLLVDNIYGVLDNIDFKVGRLDDYSIELKAKELELKELWDSMEVCPLCGKEK